MRLELSGTKARPDPISEIVLTIASDTDLNIVPYRSSYNYFEVICIGGGGGAGGGAGLWITTGGGTTYRYYPGGGGGGGYHQVRGLLKDLPDTCPVVVGDGGEAGTFSSNDLATTTAGEDGGYSSFNTTLCRASGGKGGERVTSDGGALAYNGNGGDGGVGNSITAGGGADGGDNGDYKSSDPRDRVTLPGSNGTLVDNIGKGGGGGAGGIEKTGTPGSYVGMAASDGGAGSYDSSDPMVSDPGTSMSNDGSHLEMFAGGGGGARAIRLNDLLKFYGRGGAGVSGGTDGVVIVRLTLE